jgi:hypothetical protein
MLIAWILFLVFIALQTDGMPPEVGVGVGGAFFVYWIVSYFVSARFCVNPRIARARRAARWAICAMLAGTAAFVYILYHAQPGTTYAEIRTHSWIPVAAGMLFPCLVMLVFGFHLIRDGGVLLSIPAWLLTRGHQRTAAQIGKTFERMSTRTMRRVTGAMSAFLIAQAVVLAGVVVYLGVELSRMPPPWPPGELPAFVAFMQPSPDGRYVAFVGPGRMGSRFPISVIDASGRLVAQTSPTAEPRQRDFAFEWFPSGDELVFFRATKRTPGPAGDSDDDIALFRLDVQTGDVTPFDTGGPGPQGFWTVDAQTLICRIDDEVEDGRHGLYLLVKGEAQWEVRELLPDMEELKWYGYLWSRRTETGLRLVVQAEGNSEWTDGTTSLWNVQFGSDGLLSRNRICRFNRELLDCQVSPDGSQLATVTRGTSGANMVRLYPTEGAARSDRKLTAQDYINHLAFRPDGDALLLWKNEFPPYWRDRPARLLLVDLQTSESRELPLPDGLPGISAAAWLDNDAILLGIPGEGILKLNPETGEHSYLWRMPGTGEPTKTPEEHQSEDAQ